MYTFGTSTKITMELAPVNRRQSFDGDTMSNSAPADAPPHTHSLVGKAVSTPSRLKMREALAASTRHLESKDYDLAHAVCRQAAEHAADHIMTFGTDASSKNDAKADAALMAHVDVVATSSRHAAPSMSFEFSTANPMHWASRGDKGGRGGAKPARADSEREGSGEGRCEVKEKEASSAADMRGQQPSTRTTTSSPAPAARGTEGTPAAAAAAAAAAAIPGSVVNPGSAERTTCARTAPRSPLSPSFIFPPRRTYPHRSNYPTHKCCAYLREEGFSGFVVLVILGTSFIYLITILVVHLTSLCEVLVEEPAALSYLSITPAVQVVVAILGGILLMKCVHVTAKVVCCRHYMQHKAIERLHGRRHSKWRIRRAYFWQRSWLGPTGPMVSVCGILHTRPRTS